VWWLGEKAATMTGGGGGGSEGGGPAHMGIAYSGSAGGIEGATAPLKWRWVSWKCVAAGAGVTKWCVAPEGVSAAHSARGSPDAGALTVGYNTSQPPAALLGLW